MTRFDAMAAAFAARMVQPAQHPAWDPFMGRLDDVIGTMVEERREHRA